MGSYDFHRTDGGFPVMDRDDLLEGNLVLLCPMLPMPLVNQFGIDQHAIEIEEDGLAVHIDQASRVAIPYTSSAQSVMTSLTPGQAFP